jgi:hypothetical protein
LKYRLLNDKAIKAGYNGIKVVCLKEMERHPNEGEMIQEMLK